MRKLKNRSVIDNLIADFIDTKPDAINLNFFVGCFLSLFLSIESLIKYIDEEIKQNAIKAFMQIKKVSLSKEKANTGAKNTNTFLIH